MTPSEVVHDWVRRFDAADVDGLAALHAEDAVNHQGVTDPLHAPHRVRARHDGLRVERILQDGEWAVLEWRDPLGLRGCGFFHVRNERIVFQRGYFDQPSLFRQQGLPVPDQCLA
jgi:limonene-1,2-epoxide hydrolase